MVKIRHLAIVFMTSAFLSFMTCDAGKLRTLLLPKLLDNPYTARIQENKRRSYLQRYNVIAERLHGDSRLHLQSSINEIEIIVSEFPNFLYGKYVLAHILHMANHHAESYETYTALENSFSEHEYVYAANSPTQIVIEDVQVNRALLLYKMANIQMANSIMDSLIDRYRDNSRATFFTMVRRRFSNTYDNHVLFYNERLKELLRVKACCGVTYILVAPYLEKLTNDYVLNGRSEIARLTTRIIQPAKLLRERTRDGFGSYDFAQQSFPRWLGQVDTSRDGLYMVPIIHSQNEPGP